MLLDAITAIYHQFKKDKAERREYTVPSEHREMLLSTLNTMNSDALPSLPTRPFYFETSEQSVTAQNLSKVILDDESRPEANSLNAF